MGKRYRRPISKETRQLVLDRDEHKCAKCSSTIALIVHHVKYHCDGGTNEPENLITWCYPCHTEHHEGTEKSMFLRLSARKAIQRHREELGELFDRLLAALYGQTNSPFYLDHGFLTVDPAYLTDPSSQYFPEYWEI